MTPAAPEESEIDLVLPARNEGASIARTLTEFHQLVAGQHGIRIRFVVSEDGSTDHTVSELERMKKELPLELISSSRGSGYSAAVLRGLKRTRAPLIAFIDSDGQCDPADFPQLLRLIRKHDLVVGFRHPRSDHWVRKVMSRAFKLAYNSLFDVPVRDPSCPYLIIQRPALERVLSGNVGLLEQGFWWEFIARAVALGLSIAEVPVHHRPRAAGESRVYLPSRVPKIAVQHLFGLLELKLELYRTSRH